MEENNTGPKLVWTFPIFRRFQNGVILNFGQSDSSVTEQLSDNVEKVKDSQPVRSRITNDNSGDDIEDIEQEIEEVEQSSSDIFDEDFSQPDLVSMSGDTFIPLRQSVDVGDSVTWENEDDSTHSIMTTNNEEIPKQTLDPGEQYTHTFDESGVYKYMDTVLGGDEMCGVVIVGNEEFTGTLRCEEDVDRELFASGGNRSMSQAADERMDSRSFS